MHFNTSSELSQNCTEKQIMEIIMYHPKQQQISYLMIYDVIYSLLVLIEKLEFFNKQFYGFVISLKLTTSKMGSFLTIFKLFVKCFSVLILVIAS